MNINYPAEYEIGDIAFTCIGAALFGQISAASNCWSNHVGIIIGHNGEDFLVAESRVPLSTITTLSRFIKRSANQRYAIKRLDAGLTEQQKQRIVEQVPSRLRKLYHTGFKYESSRQFCSKFVFDIYKLLLNIFLTVPANTHSVFLESFRIHLIPAKISFQDVPSCLCKHQNFASH